MLLIRFGLHGIPPFNATKRALLMHPPRGSAFCGPNALHVFKSNVVKSVEGADFVVIRVDYGLYIRINTYLCVLGQIIAQSANAMQCKSLQISMISTNPCAVIQIHMNQYTSVLVLLRFALCLACARLRSRSALCTACHVCASTTCARICSLLS